ncbi:MAG: hypothetical protein HQK89_04950 [Nitrospirae bacterium]|nr:hypothetical protein [Nitrospirota bacterium]
MIRYLKGGYSFLEGMARVLDLGCTIRGFNDVSLTPEEADIEALRSDFMAVGKDMQNSMEAVSIEYAKEKTHR